MVPPPRTGTFSPNSTQALQTGSSHSPHPSYTGGLSAAASPSTSSPTGNSSLIKIVVAQVFLLLSTIKDDKDDPSKWNHQVEQLKKLIDDYGMEVYTKYISRLIASNGSTIFPGTKAPPGGNKDNYKLLVAEMGKIALDVDQARKIAESVETGTEDLFRDFDLSTFMEHFRLDALEKTALALAFKLGPRSDLKTKADAILSTNFPTFLNLLAKPNGTDPHDLSPAFISVLVDRFIQLHPPNFNAAAEAELINKVNSRYASISQTPPSEVLAALDLIRVLADRRPNTLALYISRTGADFTRDEDSCAEYLRKRPNNVQLGEEQVALALTYTTISHTPSYNPAILVAALRRNVPPSFQWQGVISHFDRKDASISSAQFLRLYNALVPIARENPRSMDIQLLWGGNWENPEVQLSFICAFASLTPDQLDATTIPGLHTTFDLETYAQAPAAIQERAAYAIKHPLVSLAALSAIFHVALHSLEASTSREAKRLFQDVVVPNLDIFIVSAIGVPKPWPDMAKDTLNTLLDNYLAKRSPNYDFVLDSTWRKEKPWVKQRLIEIHAMHPMDLPVMFEHAVKHKWLNELVYLPNGFGLDLTAYAHAEGFIDLAEWARNNADRSTEIARSLIQFLMIKSNQEMQSQRPDGISGQAQGAKNSIPLRVRTVSALLNILEDFLPKTPVPDLILVQRSCITVYPRLINYGEGYDEIIDANGQNGNALPSAANSKMEEHYKKMYGDEMQVRTIVEILERYKHSRDPLDQDVFACMIHGLFDEYSHFSDYPLEALATTAVLFGGIISHKLISDLPLQIGLGMILEAVRDHPPDHPMYKFGLQALMQLFSRFREWPGFCDQLLQIPGLRGTEAWKKADDVVRSHDEEMGRGRNGAGALSGEALTNGNNEEGIGGEQQLPPFSAINVDAIPPGVFYEDPNGDIQGKIQFVLNNITETTLQSMFGELRQLLDDRHQQWFASHLVEERAKMQPNYHHVYLDLIKQFEDKALWREVLRETYISVQRMINSELTMQTSLERTHLKNLGGWLGLLTLARDKPIKHKNIAFKQLLIEAHDTKRLLVVIPFVCKVLISGASSNVFRPPNPWLMDIIHLLIELYHNAELKLNQKFEIEVLCKGLNLDHTSIQPSGEILNRVPIDEVADLGVPEAALESFENMSLNGIGSGVGSALSAHAIAPSIPDLGPNLSIPSVSEVIVSPTRLHEIVRSALTRALQDIIQPVVDRSVAIAAIATQQMIHKDFATEPDENRVRTAAINMVKHTAGSLALVTSKEPLRANFTNYMRSYSSDLPQGGLPEGTVIMCVTSNLDLASSIIEKSTEERAIPEIEEMIEPELEARRRHRMQRPNEPYVDPGLSRWAWTIPNPYKLSPNMGGLNSEQMAIYDDFARQPRSTSGQAVSSHMPSSSDATRAITNEVLQDQYSSVPSIPTPAETPAVPNLGAQLQPYPQAHGGAMINGRQAAPTMDTRVLVERVQKLLTELQRAAMDATEEHFSDLPRSHPLLDIVDALMQTVIKFRQHGEEYAVFAAEHICHTLFQPLDSTLMVESLVHVLESLRRMAGPALSHRVHMIFQQQPGNVFLHLPLIAALLGTDLLDWRNINSAVASALKQRKDSSLEFFDQLIDIVFLNEGPLAMYADFADSLEEAWAWVVEDPNVPHGDQFKSKMIALREAPSSTLVPSEPNASRQEQMEYVFDEWIHLCSNPNASEKLIAIFIQQIHSRAIISSKEDSLVFARLAIEKSVDRFEVNMQTGGGLVEGYAAVDSLARLMALFLLKTTGDSTTTGTSARAEYLDLILSVGVLMLNYHHVKRGEHFNQRVFYRLFSMLLHEVNTVSEQFSDVDRNEVVLKFAARFDDLGPRMFPGFIYGWLSLIQHRMFLPALLQLPSNAGWAPFTKILCQLLDYVGEQLKQVDLTNVAKDIYRATLKLLIVLQHDFPQYLAASHTRLCESIPSHCTQFLNMVLYASPMPNSKMPDPLQPGLRIDRMEESRDPPSVAEDANAVLAQAGLLNILDQALQSGPSEDAIAHITHAIQRAGVGFTGFGNVPYTVNLPLIDALILHVGSFAVARAQKGGPVFVAGASDISTLSMILHELSSEARYFFITGMINQLRYVNAHTNFFSQALMEIFGHDMADPEEMEIREQICRVLLERAMGLWPQPWGLLVTIIELVKNEKYMLFDLPFIKAAPELAERFGAIVQRQ
ncbi:uncharacterized protein E0L32_011856 [Thyridium curvatum]|uniref:General negative regulator of transcription subunit 1 n=1 Tax=Thyridium curvatum TaxID=1093900 RepID=A0A507BFF8_9PEZI|nr:uncharacterized protein E0L32_011856 [Thyridium curvatum]TPX18086.1 hypothetical protein E0L32_011856 [Thyridium curvatum]